MSQITSVSAESHQANVAYRKVMSHVEAESRLQQQYECKRYERDVAARKGPR